MANWLLGELALMHIYLQPLQAKSVMLIDFGGKSALCEHGRAEPMNW
jgi:hypothetical protein